MSADETVGPPLIPGLEYKALLGSGGFAHVYRYEQTVLGRDVAVKVIHGLDEAARRYFSSEASLMARLSSHPHVVPVYQVGVSDDDRPYLVMQLCPSPNLSQRLRNTPLPVAEVLQIGVQVAGAVETAHRLGILHRDIKPANILFSEYGRPLLADFGIAQSLEATAQPAPAFSPAWAPPEQAIGQGFEPNADVYSLCATLWAALTGKPPWGPSRPGAARGTDRPDVPHSLEELLHAGLSEEPQRRPRSAVELARGLQRVQAQLGLTVTPVELWNDPSQQETRALETDDRTRIVTLPEASAAVAATVADAAPNVPWTPPPLPLSTPTSVTPWPASGSAPRQERRRRLPWWLLLIALLLVIIGAVALWPRGDGPRPPAVHTPVSSTTPAQRPSTDPPRPTQTTTPAASPATPSADESAGGELGGGWGG
ncbi:serine/threonine-protein kinase [Luteococcus japonicus]|uniref:Transcriptional activator of maltose regulon, MalT n=1 Tax=Luteococcus japonicus LSP_Lj1 TaxID=1255658 RepID=A0A1R4IYY6_9ACTN|nr:serine/threonine-protein kinase [Luteococcus japonicus]SJN24949.1 Transcriptional activator of maltose regulon, MalT [Luteococcus japonicus LSP_Lj1]